MSNAGYVNSSSVVLVSGGARGITAKCVVKLAERAGCKFILLGRSGLDENLPHWAMNGHSEAELKRFIMEDLIGRGQKPTPQAVQSLYRRITSSREIADTLAQIRQAGGQAEYVQVDITDRRAMLERLRGPVQRLGPVTGVIHGAGSLADKLIEKKSEEDFETVYSPKIAGLENLLACAPVSQLRFLVLFSSIVGFYGNVGQADYAIANEILNKTAHLMQRKYPSVRVISIDWGPWEAGMVTPELKKLFEARNIHVIPVEVGARMLVEELAPSRSRGAQVIVGDPPAYPADSVDTNLRRYQIRRKLKLEANPFLFDHRIGEQAVLPATCAATWVASACEQLYPGLTFFSLEHYKVLKGIVFDNSLADEYVLELEEVAKSPEGVEFDALVWSQNRKGRKLFHYSLRTKLVRAVEETPAMPTELPNGSHIEGQDLYQNGTLFHGPSFQGIQKVLHVDRERLVMQTNLPEMSEAHQGQFQVGAGNPFIYDAIVQCLLVWTQHFYEAPCLPSRLDKFEQFRPIPFGKTCTVVMQVVSASENSVVGDIVVQDEQGGVYVKITRLEGTISHHLKQVLGVRPQSWVPAP